MISVPPLALLQSDWLPLIVGTVQRAQALLFFAPGITPTSWWRSVQQNRSAGGSPESQHLFGLAVDFTGSEDALRRAQSLATGVGLIPVREPSHLHVQLFPRGALARVGVQFPV